MCIRDRHPLLTLLVVVGTANHYWLDAIVVGALLAVAYAALRLPRTPVRAHLPWPAAPARNYASPAYARSGAQR